MPFTKETLDFLVENRMRNDRPWYNAHKDEFARKVLAPFQALVQEMTPGMREIDPLFETAPKVDKTISRVYRDTRFTHDKSLFRDVMWIVFQRAKHVNATGLPGFWFELAPDRLMWGCGYYQAAPAFLAAVRERILADDPMFRKARKMYEAQDTFILDGDRYKRSKHPEQPEAMRFWLDRKSVGLSTVSKDFELAFSDKLAARLVSDFQMLRPMYDFWCDVEISRQDMMPEKRKETSSWT